MGLKYAIFHWSFHLFFVILISLVFKLDFFNFLLAFLAAGFIDIDHMSKIKKLGLIGWAKKSMEFHIPRKYPLHNFLFLFILFILSFLVLFDQLFSLGIIFLSMFCHLLFDFLEDVLIFRMGTRHWKI